MKHIIFNYGNWYWYYDGYGFCLAANSSNQHLDRDFLVPVGYIVWFYNPVVKPYFEQGR